MGPGYNDCGKMQQGEEKKYLTGIKMTGSPEAAEGDQHFNGTNGKKWGVRLVLQGEHYAGQDGNKEGDETFPSPVGFKNNSADIHGSDLLKSQKAAITTVVAV
jgi:hypothetical protein